MLRPYRFVTSIYKYKVLVKDQPVEGGFRPKGIITEGVNKPAKGKPAVAPVEAPSITVPGATVQLPIDEIKFAKAVVQLLEFGSRYLA